LRAVQHAQDALDAVKAEHLASLETSGGFEADGASSIRVWAANELRLDVSETRMLVAAGATMQALPQVAEATRGGQVRVAHVKAFTYGLAHVGADVITESQDWLLDVARTCEPSELHAVVRALRDAVHPDDLDRAWAEGMDKQDIQVNALPTGWHVTGHLSTVLGAKLRTVLDSLGAPRNAEDARTGAQRRTDALDELLTTVLDNGLPSDRGVRPHVSVLADLDTLQAMVKPSLTRQVIEPAHLVGFGSIGQDLLSYLTCTSNLTAILTNGTSAGEVPQAEVLNVGRTFRLATPKQRKAVIARQGGVCATPGCRGTHLEMHHPHWWSKGGKTNLNNLVGLCTRCHHLAHRGLLTITPDDHGGFTITNHDGRLLRKGHRQRLERQHEARRIIRTRLTHQTRNGVSRT